MSVTFSDDEFRILYECLELSTVQKWDDEELAKLMLLEDAAMAILTSKVPRLGETSHEASQTSSDEPALEPFHEPT